MSRWPHPIETIQQEVTLLWHEIENWQQDNSAIHTGYRKQSNSYWDSFARSVNTKDKCLCTSDLIYNSLYYLHNETVNIYSHLLGACMFALIIPDLYRRLKPLYKTATNEDLAVFSCFFVGCLSCLTMSAIFHLVSDHSDIVAKWGNQMDYLGIVLLIWGSFIPSIYYGFQERKDLVKVYWSTVCHCP
jgi:adiponectin receptor